jgi:hypothetical protein
MVALDLTAEQWAARVRPHLGRAVESIIAAGDELVSAKAALPHGAFLLAVELTGLTPRSAQRFMAIASNPVLSNATHVSHLPASWGTLYELAKTPAAALEAELEDGTIRPSLDRKSARRFAAHARIQAAADERALDDIAVQIRKSMYGTGVCLARVCETCTEEQFVKTLVELAGELEQETPSAVAEMMSAAFGGNVLEYLICCLGLARWLPDPDFSKPWEQQRVET